MASRCFLCDGTGKMCNICGESKLACSCTPGEVEEYLAKNGGEQFADCPDCEGLGE